MRRAFKIVFTAAMLGCVAGIASADAGLAKYYEVAGVDDDDLLKMRAGPGIGFKVIVGLPNGTVLRVHSCETAGKHWCKVSLKQARGLKGYVSHAYLRGL